MHTGALSLDRSERSSVHFQASVCESGMTIVGSQRALTRLFANPFVWVPVGRSLGGRIDLCWLVSSCRRLLDSTGYPPAYFHAGHRRVAWR
jgi:hypothetical protein